MVIPFLQKIRKYFKLMKALKIKKKSYYYTCKLHWQIELTSKCYQVMKSVLIKVNDQKTIRNLTVPPEPH